MKKNITILALATLTTLGVSAEKLDIKKLRVAGPFTSTAAIQIDTIDASGTKFDNDALLKDGISPQLWKNGTETSDSILAGKDKPSVYLAGFTFENTRYAKCNVSTSGKQQHLIYIDNKQGGDQNLLPGRHEVVIKVLCKSNENDTLSVSLKSDQSDYITVNPTGSRIYTLADYMNGQKASTHSLSANGRYMMFNRNIVRTDGKTEWSRDIIDLKTGAVYGSEGFREWASTGDRYIKSRRGVDNETIYEYVDPATGATTPLFTDYTGSNGGFLAGEKEMLVYKQTDGPREDPQIYQILEPDDRIPGWRNRSNPQLLDVATDQLTQLTVGHHNVNATPSEDGRQILLMTWESKMTERPFNFASAYLYNRDTQQMDTLFQHDGFVEQGQFSADGKSIIFMGSPEAFKGIGINDPTGKTPSMIQKELFLMDLATKQVKSLTYDFNPSISNYEISRVDGYIYALCENRDLQNIFRINPKTGKITQLHLSEEYITSFSLAYNKAMLSYSGQSASNATRVYTVDLKNDKETLVRDYNAIRMKDIQLGEFAEWNFKSSRGDTIYGRYYLPPHFDANKKYPMLVYYYGGCSPTGRYLESYYNFHGWAAMGYVVYVVQPSGCTGFGQEFAARHVNTYGEGTADDIIEGTKKFCLEHPYVNDKKIGCLGASYGGFMTQYLVSHSDVFAAAMSHAGISNPTSYWGYGYWGYSYSATSAANSYPWNNEKLLSGQAPLFNADKVHTPILFLHGSADTNVPLNESIQMFNALKILGRECAFVVVDGQDHHITDYQKQQKWVSTYYAWFAKWLQDDSTWWDTLYPKKNL